MDYLCHRGGAWTWQAFPGAGERLAMLDEGVQIMRQRIAWMRSHLLKYVPAEVAERRVRDFASGPLVGTPEQISERLSALSKLGMTYAIINLLEVAYDRSTLTLFTEKVAPALATA